MLFVTLLSIFFKGLCDVWPLHSCVADRCYPSESQPSLLLHNLDHLWRTVFSSDGKPLYLSSIHNAFDERFIEGTV